MKIPMKHWLKERLLHFALLGALIFAVGAWRERQRPAETGDAALRRFFEENATRYAKQARVNIAMPQLDGLEAARELRRTSARVRLVFLTVQDDADLAGAALAAGALGYVVEVRLASDLLTAIRVAHAGRRFISRAVYLDDAA